MSNVVVAVKNQDKKTTAMELIFFPLMFMIFIGLIFNNFNASGLQANGGLITTQFTRTDTTLSRNYCILGVDTGCSVQVNPQPTGCALSLTNCNASSLKGIQFLNPNSPFTILLGGNLIGFFSSVFNSGESQNVVYSGFTFCIPTFGNSFFNATGQNIHNFICEGITSVNSTNFKPTTGIPMNATANGGNNSIWSVTGCRLDSSFNYPCRINGNGNGFATWNGTNAESSFYGFYISNNTSIKNSATCSIFSTNPTCQIIMPWLYTNGVTTFTCPNTLHISGLNINATHYYCLLPVTNPETPTTTGAEALPNIFAGFSFIFGVILFFMGIGVALTSALIGFQINEQGTKLAQVFGFAIVVWAFISSEFGWIFVTTFNVNGGLIGTILSLSFGLVYITLTAMFFVGVYWRLFSLE